MGKHSFLASHLKTFHILSLTFLNSFLTLSLLFFVRKKNLLTVFLFNLPSFLRANGRWKFCAEIYCVHLCGGQS